MRIEDYALLGDGQTAALVGANGSIDWLCVPRFDSAACFAALLGTPENGQWQLSPSGQIRASRRHYRGETLVLETDFDTDGGSVTVVDCMPQRQTHPQLVRMVIGRRGQVSMRSLLTIRFGYGATIPWVQRYDGGIRAIAGPDALIMRTPVALKGEAFTTVADFTVSAGQEVPFVLTWYPSHEDPPAVQDAATVIRETQATWTQWTGRCRYQGPWREAVIRSLITLKALRFDPTGGIVAAPTTSLPEALGGVRNWDYRFCWLRDATFTLFSLLLAGYTEEATAWREWLLRAVAGTPDTLQILYGVTGERRLAEWSVDWLAGYEESRPVRVGNAASEQFQLDVYGEVLDLLYQCRRHGVQCKEISWPVERKVLEFLETAWQQPDDGIWEVRGPRQHFTHSKMMAWVAFDRGIKSAEQFGLEAPLERWRAVRSQIHEQVCRAGFDDRQGAFVQYYGSTQLDASLLMMPMVGFLPPDDPRVVSTVTVIERHLVHDGFVHRYQTESNVDGLPPGEGAFLPCSFWLADALALIGRPRDAQALFERLLAIRNDLGLLSEQYDVSRQRLVGNFPQAFTHVGLVNTAFNLTADNGPAERRPAQHHSKSSSPP